MSCEKYIEKGFELNCDNAPKKGIEQSVTIMNTSDIDKGATVFDTTGMAIENITLKAGAKRAYLLKGTKNILNAGATFVAKEDTFDAWNHRLNAYIADLSIANLVELRAYTNGAEITAIVETKNLGASGTGESKYKVLGYDVGMMLTEANLDFNENGGLPFVLSNKDGFENNQPPFAFFNTDLTTTKTAVTALLTATV